MIRTIESWYKIFAALKEMPRLKNVPLAFALATLMDNLSGPISNAERVRDQLITSLGERCEDSTYRVPPHNMDEFKRKYDELMGLEVEVEFEMFPLSALEGAELSPHQLMILKPLIKG